MIELIPFRELSVREHAAVFHNLVRNNTDVLNRRYMGGVALKYGGSEAGARTNFEAAIKADARQAAIRAETPSLPPSKQERYAVNTTVSLPGAVATGGLVGALTRFRELEARSLRFPLPPVITRAPLLRSVLTSPFTFARPEANISAWVDNGITNYGHVKATTLAAAYRQGAAELEEDELPWTFEPLPFNAEAQYAHDALAFAGFNKLGQPGRFDVGESARTVPPIMDVYVWGEPAAQAA